MAASGKSFLHALALCLAVSPGEGYEFAANCVPGGVVSTLGATDGKIALYVLALQKIMPTIYGNLVFMAEGPGGECDRAANLVNTNLIHPDNILTKFTNMSQVGAIQGLNKAVPNKSYLYVFKSKNFREYSVIADCVPGGIVGGLSQTGGRVALYTMALTTILPGIFGNLQYLGQGNNSACMTMMNAINEGNKTVVDINKKNVASFGMKEIGVLQGLQVADNTTSYIYVFKNKMWNSSWKVMLPNLQSYGIPV